jgi:uncharacterized protein YdeI (YjbR/CyaY-like superfamily)
MFELTPSIVLAIVNTLDHRLDLMGLSNTAFRALTPKRQETLILDTIHEIMSA